ncbi:MAG TPA: diacylglycerol kinase family protein [Gaiellaceae bacterium]|nr:diacylglycerol kinase family protein [Gaiellaceae bacterium]
MSALTTQTAAPAPERARPWRSAERHIVLVGNGNASGVGRSRAALVAACRSLGLRGVRVETHLTESPAELAAAWPSFADRRVVLLGGDGTLHAAANLPPGPPDFAILPAGRANNVARALGIPLGLKAAAELAAEGRPRHLDLIAATSDELSYRAVEGVSVGLHAVARAGYRAPNSADLPAAARSALRAARAFDGVTLSLSSDGVPEVLAVGQLFVANLSLYAFGLRVAPSARPDDGRLDVVALPWEGRARILPMVARLRRGTHVERASTRVWSAERVRVATGGRSPVVADTTNLGTGPVTLEVAPAALPLVAP